jgi:hypothetical protein
MDAQQFIALFGTRAGDPKLEAFLTGLAVKERPKLAKGEFDAHVEAKREGFSLLFEDEAYFKGEEKPLGKSPLLLVGAFFYSEGHEDLAQFKGQLPEDLVFSDSREDAVRKLGPSEWKKEKGGTVRRERWVLSNYKVIADYGPAAASITVVYCGLNN